MVMDLKTPIAAMNDIEDIYRPLFTSGYYGQAIPSRTGPQANLAGVPANEQQLSQD
jgi:hypothetical protein